MKFILYSIPKYGGQKSKKGAEKFLKSKLSPEQSKKLSDVLSDENALKNLLSSDRAKELFKKLGGKDAE